ncbi:ASCH domain-containing protein [Paenibacillus sp. NPDC056722]|uniref:ASCH domain-containing protein n=1 Tax=Paenibacillus sp. NPDC056722 TaxID=3345924 RepID=UPI00369F840D
MNNTEQIEQFWKEYLQLHPGVSHYYEAWAFGDSPEMADELLDLVLRGIKTGTSSNYAMYELEGGTPPRVGDQAILLNGLGQPKAVILTTKVDVLPFNEVSAEFAYTEGEGDRTLDYWRAVHEDFFSREANFWNVAFDTGIMVLCENFEVVYSPSHTL